MSRTSFIPPRLFAAQLASRILAVVSAASVAIPYASCGGSPAAQPDGGGTTGMGGAPASTATVTGTGGGAGGGGSSITFTLPDASLDAYALPGPSAGCVDWPPSAGACPTADDDAGYSYAIYYYNLSACIDGGGSGIEVSQVQSGPATANPDDAGQCCYVFEWMFCPGGGRPYLVDDQPRVASVLRGTESRWAEGERPRVDDLTAAERAALAAAWTADALAEHASVASFSRFSLALLAVGAPGDLLHLAHGAALDEVRHAQLCFALASAYAGEPLAPGRFPAGEAMEVGASLAALAVSTVREGCIGETVAAVLAAEQLARATDPAVRAALAEIAADEARHAELAWRTVAWAVETGGCEVRTAVSRAFGEAVAKPGAAGGPSGNDAAPAPAVYGAHGRLEAAVMEQVVAAVMASVVGPSARALLTPGPRAVLARASQEDAWS